MAESWHVAKGKTKLGPFTREQLEQLARSGELLPSDMVLRAGSGKWQAASTVAGLFASPERPSVASPRKQGGAASAGATPPAKPVHPRPKRETVGPPAKRSLGKPLLIGCAALGVFGCLGVASASVAFYYWVIAAIEPETRQMAALPVGVADFEKPPPRVAPAPNPEPPPVVEPNTPAPKPPPVVEPAPKPEPPPVAPKGSAPGNDTEPVLGKAPEKLDGKWFVARQEEYGHLVPAAVSTRLSMIIDGAKMEWYIGNPAPNFAATITVDAEKGIIDARITRSSFIGKTMLGIYKIEDGQLHICWGEIGTDQRPATYASTKRGGGAFNYTIYSRKPVDEGTAVAKKGPPAIKQPPEIKQPPQPKQPAQLKQPKQRAVLKGLAVAVDTMVISPDSMLLAAGGQYGPEGELKLWDLTTGKQRVNFKGSTQFPHVAFSADGKTLASCGMSRETGEFKKLLKLYDPQGKKPTVDLEMYEGMLALAFSADGKMLAIGCADKTVRVFDPQCKKEILTLQGAHTDLIQAVAFSPDSKTIASGGIDDKLICLWDAEKGKERAVLRGHTEQVRQLAFSPDGKLLASAGWDKSVRLWDAATGEVKAVLAHDDSVTSVAFSRDGKILAAAVPFGEKIVLWDVESRREMARIKTEARPNRVAFTPDGKTLAAGMSDGTIILWDSPGR